MPDLSEVFAAALAWGALVWKLAASAGAAVLAGVAVKIMDDLLDRDADLAGGLCTWAGAIGAGSVPYALASLGLAAALDVRLTVALFLASYAVGMASDGRAGLPLGLPSWGESLVALGLSLLIAGPRQALAGLAAVAAIQLLDHWLDRPMGQAVPVAGPLMAPEALVAGGGLAVAALALDGRTALLALAAWPATLRLLRCTPPADQPGEEASW